MITLILLSHFFPSEDEYISGFFFPPVTFILPLITFSSWCFFSLLPHPPHPLPINFKSFAQRMCWLTVVLSWKGMERKWKLHLSNVSVLGLECQENRYPCISMHVPSFVFPSVFSLDALAWVHGLRMKKLQLLTSSSGTTCTHYHFWSLYSLFILLLQGPKGWMNV